MKTKSMNLRGLAGHLRGASACAALLLAGMAAVCQAQNSPTTVAFWDCLISGPRQGVAYLSFFPDSTFSCYEVIVPNQPPTPSNARSPAGDFGRAGSTGGTNSLGEQIYGAEITGGVWGYDINGRVIGEFIEVSAATLCVTNAVPFLTNGPYSSVSPIAVTNENAIGYCVVNILLATNPPIGGVTNFTVHDVCFSNAVSCTQLTNAISFLATVVPGTRLTLACSTPFGKVFYRGTPSVNLPSLSGSWYGIKRRPTESWVEFFTLAASSSGIPNTYDVVNGVGPGYTYGGVALLSSHNKFGFVVTINQNDLDVRGVVGPFNPAKNQALTHGWDESGTSLTNWITFQATKH